MVILQYPNRKVVLNNAVIMTLGHTQFGGFHTHSCICLCICSFVWFYLACTVLLPVPITKQMKQSALHLRFILTRGLSPRLVGPAALEPVGRACVSKVAHLTERGRNLGLTVASRPPSQRLEDFLRVYLFKFYCPSLVPQEGLTP